MRISDAVCWFFDFADLGLEREALDSPAASRMDVKVGVISFATGPMTL